MDYSQSVLLMKRSAGSVLTDGCVIVLHRPLVPSTALCCIWFNIIAIFGRLSSEWSRAISTIRVMKRSAGLGLAMQWKCNRITLTSYAPHRLHVIKYHCTVYSTCKYLLLRTTDCWCHCTVHSTCKYYGVLMSAPAMMGVLRGGANWAVMLE